MPQHRQVASPHWPSPLPAGVLLPSGCRSGAGRALTGLSFMQTVLLPSPGPSEHTGQGQVHLGAAPSAVRWSPPPLASVSCFLDGPAACSPLPGDGGLGKAGLGPGTGVQVRAAGLTRGECWVWGGVGEVAPSLRA